MDYVTNIEFVTLHNTSEFIVALGAGVTQLVMLCNGFDFYGIVHVKMKLQKILLKMVGIVGVSLQISPVCVAKPFKNQYHLLFLKTTK